MEPGDYMHVTISMMEICDMVLMLEGWENSGGAKIESDYAKYIGIPCLSMGTFVENYLGDQEDPEAPERAAEEETGKPTEKAATRAERMFGPKAGWDMPARDPAGEKTGVKGFVIIRCEECGETRGFCTKSEITYTTCKSCGHKTEIRETMPLYLNCKCGKSFRYRTNILEGEAMTWNCLGCGNPVDLEMGSKRTAWKTVGFGRAGGVTAQVNYMGKSSWWMGSGKI